MPEVVGRKTSITKSHLATSASSASPASFATAKTTFRRHLTPGGDVMDNTFLSSTTSPIPIHALAARGTMVRTRATTTTTTTTAVTTTAATARWDPLPLDQRRGCRVCNRLVEYE